MIEQSEGVPLLRAGRSRSHPQHSRALRGWPTTTSRTPAPLLRDHDARSRWGGGRHRGALRRRSWLDLRGERSSPTDFAELLNRFYRVATDTLVRHDAVIDKLIGDEAMAFFVRGISGPGYRQKAVEAGAELLSAVGYETPEGPWLNMGVAVNARIAYVGNVGGAAIDFAALGDTVSVAARMQGEAAGGELLVRAGVGSQPAEDTPRRTLNLRGHEEPVEVLVVNA